MMLIWMLRFMFLSNSGEIDPLFEFGKEGEVQKFLTTSDNDHNEGFSECTFQKSPSGYGLFSGILNSTVRQTDKQKRTGYCNMRSMRVRVRRRVECRECLEIQFFAVFPSQRSFKREGYWDWSPYTHLGKFGPHFTSAPVDNIPFIAF